MPNQIVNYGAVTGTFMIQSSHFLCEYIHHDLEVGPDIVEPAVTGRENLGTKGKNKLSPSYSL